MDTEVCTDVICNEPPNNQCWFAHGTCDDSLGYAMCTYETKDLGTLCNDSNPFTINDQCLANGTCAGVNGMT